MNGKQLKYYRNQLGISQSKLAQETGIAYGTISSIEASPEKPIKKVGTLEILYSFFKEKGVIEKDDSELKEAKETIQKLKDELMDLQKERLKDKDEIIRLTNQLHNKSPEMHQDIDAHK